MIRLYRRRSAERPDALAPIPGGEPGRECPHNGYRPVQRPYTHRRIHETTNTRLTTPSISRVSRQLTDHVRKAVTDDSDTHNHPPENSLLTAN